MSVRPAILAGLMLALAGGGCAHPPAPPPPGSPVNLGQMEPAWVPHKEYLEKLIAKVQVQWERILVESRVYPAAGSQVKVKFRLDRQGRVAGIISVDGDANGPGTKMCVMAITSQSPYGVWTDAMAAALGESQEMTFTFYYQ